MSTPASRSAGGLLLGVDVGTSGTKALLADASGAVVAVATREHPLHAPRPLWSEQEPDDWWRSATEAIRAVLAEARCDAAAIAAVGLTGQMHGLVLLDAANRPLRPAILWNDQRTAAECAEIHRRIGAARTIAITGKPALTGFTAPKILWVAQHEPEAWRAARTILLPKDYVRLRLTGTKAIDVADASGTSLLDLAGRCWSDEMIEALDVPRDRLPTVRESPEVCARVSAEGAKATGLLAGTPVVAGAGDQAAEALGCGVTRPGAVATSVGTSGVVFAATERPDVDPAGRLHAYCHALPGRWHFMGVMLSAGGSLRWFRDALAPDLVAQARECGVDPYDLILAEAATAPPGCEGLAFLPYLTGERTPHPDPDARGAFVGLTLRSRRAHLARAVVEGIAFGLRDALDIARDLGLPIASIRVSGGATRSAFFRGVLADAFAAPVATVNATQGAAFGAALLAGVGAGAFADGDAAAATVREVERSEPSGVALDAACARYRALYPALAPWWRGSDA